MKFVSSLLRRMPNASLAGRTALVSGLCVLASCATPPQNLTSIDQNTARCQAAEASGQLQQAEQACQQALASVVTGPQESPQRSQKLYNLARIKRFMGKYDEAEKLLKESLVLEAKVSPNSELRIGRRNIELAANLAAQDKWSEGATALQHSLTTSTQFSGADRIYARELLRLYQQKIQATQPALADQFALTLAKLN